MYNKCKLLPSKIHKKVKYMQLNLNIPGIKAKKVKSSLQEFTPFLFIKIMLYKYTFPL